MAGLGDAPSPLPSPASGRAGRRRRPFATFPRSATDNVETRRRRPLSRLRERVRVRGGQACGTDRRSRLRDDCVRTRPMPNAPFGDFFVIDDWRASSSADRFRSDPTSPTSPARQRDSSSNSTAGNMRSRKPTRVATKPCGVSAGGSHGSGTTRRFGIARASCCASPRTSESMFRFRDLIKVYFGASKTSAPSPSPSPAGGRGRRSMA